MRLFTVSQQFELIPQSPCHKLLMEGKKRSKDINDQDQRKWPRWNPWNKDRNETCSRTEGEKQGPLDFSDLQVALDLLHEDHKEKEEEKEKQQEEVQKTKYNQKEEELVQKGKEEIQKEEEQTYHQEQTSSSSSGEWRPPRFHKDGQVWEMYQGSWWLQPKEGSTWWEKWEPQSEEKIHTCNSGRYWEHN